MRRDAGRYGGSPARTRHFDRYAAQRNALPYAAAGCGAYTAGHCGFPPSGTDFRANPHTDSCTEYRTGSRTNDCTDSMPPVGIHVPFVRRATPRLPGTAHIRAYSACDRYHMPFRGKMQGVFAKEKPVSCYPHTFWVLLVRYRSENRFSCKDALCNKRREGPQKDNSLLHSGKCICLREKPFVTLIQFSAVWLQRVCQRW